MDMVSAICPNCHIILVEASSNSITDLGSAANAAVKLGAKYVANSYGEAESPADSKYDTAYFRPRRRGDRPHQGTRATGWWITPASSRYVTAVGGTTLTPTSSGRDWAETVWGGKAGGAGTGSGCSAYEAKPSWQHDTGCAHRTDNDVAADANPNTGVAIYDSYSQGGWTKAGGTSVAAAIIASVYALHGPPAPGTYPASYPYANPADLYKITSGANGTCTPSYLCTAWKRSRTGQGEEARHKGPPRSPRHSQPRNSATSKRLTPGPAWSRRSWTPTKTAPIA